MPRLLILCEYGTLNGGERSMLATLPGISRAGYEVRVAAPAAGPLSETLRGRGIEVIPFGPRDFSGTRPSIEERRRRLAEIIDASRPALLHANSLAMGRLSGPVAAELGVPSISHLRDIVTLGRQAVADLNHHDRLLAVSQATRRFHVDQGVVADKTVVLYNGVDAEQFRPRPTTGYLHDELRLPRSCPLLGTIGQISLRKGHDVLAAALARLAQQLPSHSGREAGGEGTPFSWLIIGQRFSAKDESRQLEDELHRAAEGALAGRVFFLGNRDDVDQVLPELTLLVHPARQEPLGRVLLEGAASGCAIVATDVGGTREIIPPESEAACLVAPGDVPAMSAAIERLLHDPIQRRRLADNARRRVEQAFDQRLADAGLVKCYEALRRR